MATFGKLEPVEIRSGWPREDYDFTPWLAQPENLALLGAEIGMDLELVAMEAFVGQYRADILARRMNTEESVVIENQYGYTDHSHLGQLLTYAAGLGSAGSGAKTIVWIAEKFTEPHRAALDWLNQSTDQGISFFGIELQLWRIGDSALAPKFSLVSRPNEFQKELSRRATALSETEKLYQEFWSGFIAFCGPATSLVMGSAPSQYYLATAVGRSGFGVNFTASRRNRCMECQLWMEGPSAKDAFQMLADKTEEIIAALGPDTKFNEMPGRKACSILESKPWDISNKEEWPQYYKWFKRRGEAYVALFRPMIAQLQLN